jgi:hypothetical protein
MAQSTAAESLLHNRIKLSHQNLSHPNPPQGDITLAEGRRCSLHQEQAIRLTCNAWTR